MNKVLVICLILAAVVVVTESNPCLKKIKSYDSGCDCDQNSSHHDDSNDGGSGCGSEKKEKKHKSKPCN